MSAGYRYTPIISESTTAPNTQPTQLQEYIELYQQDREQFNNFLQTQSGIHLTLPGYLAFNGNIDTLLGLHYLGIPINETLSSNENDKFSTAGICALFHGSDALIRLNNAGISLENAHYTRDNNNTESISNVAGILSKNNKTDSLIALFGHAPQLLEHAKINYHLHEGVTTPIAKSSAAGIIAQNGNAQALISLSSAGVSLDNAYHSNTASLNAAGILAKLDNTESLITLFNHNPDALDNAHIERIDDNLVKYSAAGIIAQNKSNHDALLKLHQANVPFSNACNFS